MNAIECQKVVKQYKNGVRALNDLSLTVKCGEIFSLLGPNGAGKSSLINILTTYYKPTEGKINMLGKNLCKEPAWIRTKIACVAQRVSIDAHLSLKENMMFQSRLYKVNRQIAKERIDSLIRSFDLSGYLKYPVASYSGGVKRRLDIAMNMISLPEILFLDEPTVAMDVESRKSMWKMLLKIRDTYGTTIFLTTHYLEEADYLSNTICIMKDGKELIQGKPSDLRKYTKQNLISITFSSVEERNRHKEKIEKEFSNQVLIVREKSILVGVNDIRKDFIRLNQWLLDHSVPFDRIEILEPSLEDVFLAMTGSGSNQGEE